MAEHLIHSIWVCQGFANLQTKCAWAWQVRVINMVYAAVVFDQTCWLTWPIFLFSKIWDRQIEFLSFCRWKRSQRSQHNQHIYSPRHRQSNLPTRECNITLWGRVLHNMLIFVCAKQLGPLQETLAGSSHHVHSAPLDARWWGCFAHRVWSGT